MLLDRAKRRGPQVSGAPSGLGSAGLLQGRDQDVADVLVPLAGHAGDIAPIHALAGQVTDPRRRGLARVVPFLDRLGQLRNGLGVGLGGPGTTPGSCWFKIE
jgi:hypothetical protein